MECVAGLGSADPARPGVRTVVRSDERLQRLRPARAISQAERLRVHKDTHANMGSVRP